MGYRDEHEASVARLVALEVELAARRGVSQSLRRYKAALEDERARLEHAILWYRNGERFGWTPAAERDDLSPPEAPDVRLPGVAQLARVYQNLDDREVARRTVDVEAQLANGHWQIGRLRFACDELRAANATLREAVSVYAGRYPEYPPPPALRLGPELALGVTASVGGLWVALMLLTALMS